LDQSDKKPKPGKELADEARPTSAMEAQLLIEQYANDLRAIIEKLRKRLS
jgi:hypothetical protein